MTSTVRELLGPHAAPCHRAVSAVAGVALPAFVDHHVHLHLIDDERMPDAGIAAVVDLGGDPAALARRAKDGMPHVAYAGAFLTAPGGYPSGRSWAPDTIVRVVSDPSLHPGVPGGVATAIDDQASFGASVIKIALNTAAGPIFGRTVLGATVDYAHERGLPVVAHVEGAGTARLAIDAGVDVLAHTPFSEILPAELVARAAGGGQRWISTLDIHFGQPSEAFANANLTAFAAAGGRVLYGTDLGNGDLPLGVNTGELAALDAAGVRGPQLIATLIDPWPLEAPTTSVSTYVPGPAPSTLDDVPAWLAGAIVVPTEELIHDEP